MIAFPSWFTQHQGLHHHGNQPGDPKEYGPSVSGLSSMDVSQARAPSARVSSQEAFLWGGVG